MREAPMPPRLAFEMGVPVLGICYGQQIMMHCLGGHVEGGHGPRIRPGRMSRPEKTSLSLLEGWFDDGDEQVWMSHGDRVSKLAPGL